MGSSESEWLDPVVRVELNCFRGRLFITGGWASDWGQAVSDDIEAGDLGSLLLRGLQGERAGRRPMVRDMDDFFRTHRAERRGWQRFCSKVAGVTVADYSPEIRVEVYDLSDGLLRVRALTSGDIEAGSELPSDVDAETLGALVLEMLTSTLPEWPIVHGASVHVATRNRLVIYPQRSVAGGSVQVLRGDSAAEVVGDAVRLALSESATINDDSPLELWEQALLAAGVNQRMIAGRRMVHVSERSDGSFRVAAMTPVRGGWEGVGLHGDCGVIEFSHYNPVHLGSAVLELAMK